MPYSETAHSRLVASALASASMTSMTSTIPFCMLYPDMHIPHVDLHGKTAIVTGANSGIGYECARSFAGMGARVVLVCRNESRGEEARRKIVEDTGNEKVEVEVMDCGRLESVTAFVERWGKRELKQVDILINNAGGFTPRLRLTPDGFEQTYQVNHLSHVLLTFSLLNRGFIAPNARIISVSSIMFYESDVLDLSNADNGDIIANHNAQAGSVLAFDEMTNLYRRSKASQAVWVMVLQRYLSKTERWKDVIVQACHPGYVNSPIWTQPDGGALATGIKARSIISLAKATGITNEQGAITLVWLATATEPTSPELRGMFWSRMRWNWVWPWSLETKRQSMLWDKWCQDAQISLLV